MIGSVVGKRYRIGERLGGGGMAVVYRAEDLQLGRPVAVKVLRGQFGGDEDFVRRFRREAQNAASLSHPNVVQIFDVGQEEDLYYIVLELVEGLSLKELIQKQGPLPVGEAARIGMEILSALAHAHANRIVHRDIKPHNILLSTDGKVKVTDFGIARATNTDTVTHTGSIMGSAHYFSPEQANGQPTGEKSDIYSMGIVLYEMVTGQVPFQGDSPITVALKHVRERVLPPSRLNAEVPVEMDEIVLRALMKDPAHRYGSAAEMRLALQRFAEAHAAGLTHMNSGDFPTMDLRGLKTRKVRPDMPALDEPEDEPWRGRERPAPRRRKSPLLWISIIAAVVVIGIGAAAWTLIDYLDVPEVDVPDVSNLTLAEAKKRLGDVKLNSEVRNLLTSNEVPVDLVIKTEPPARTRVKEGKLILLDLSKGPEKLLLPDVRGSLVDDAKLRLDNLGFTVGDVKYVQNPDVEEGKVTEMFPLQGTQVLPKATVNLTVSTGPLRVPPLVGKTLAEARQLLRESGLLEGRLEMRSDPLRTPGTVLASRPEPGTRISKGQTVDLVISQGTNAGKPFKKVVTIQTDPSKFYDTKIIMVDTVGGVSTEQTLFEGRVQGGRDVTVQGQFFGTASLRVIVDGKELGSIALP